MTNNLSIFATLALAVALLPAAFAQQRQSTQPKADQAQSQPGSEQPQSQTAPSASADTQTQNSFSGMVVKAGEHYVLKTDKMTYRLDDETRAKQFEGKQVTVNGAW